MSPMPEHLADQPLGIERLELVELLTLADKLDRHAGDPPHRQCRPAAGIAVELGQDHAVELERLVERLGRGDRVLPGHGVADEKDLVRLDLLLDHASARPSARHRRATARPCRE